MTLIKELPIPWESARHAGYGVLEGGGVQRGVASFLSNLMGRGLGSFGAHCVRVKGLGISQTPGRIQKVEPPNSTL